MHELVYAGKNIEVLVKKEYPKAQIKDASDYIHTERFELEIDDITEDDFYIWAIRKGIAECCFGFSLMMKDCPEGKGQQVWDWFAEAIAIDESESIKPPVLS